MRLTRRQFLASSGAALASAAWRPATPRREPPPNLLLIVSDDQALEDLGCYGNATIGTPSLDQIAAGGVRFTQAFTPTSVCQPSRGCLHTGLYGTSSGATEFTPIKPGIPTLSTVLKEAGYRTGLVGKTHLDPISQFRFDFLKTSDELGNGRDVEGIRDATRWFIKKCKEAKQPFFLNVNFDDPHFPWPLTKGEAEPLMVQWKKDHHGISPVNRALGDVAGLHPPDKVRLPGLFPDLPAIRQELARYCDAITRLDRGVGYLLRVLDKLEVADRTVILFVSDNGIEFPFHKRTPWEGGVHLPMIARWPGVTPPGSTCDGMVSFVDVMPTLLEIAGAKPPPYLEGRSFRAALEKPETPLRDEIVLAIMTVNGNDDTMSRGLRTTRFKYIRNAWGPRANFMIKAMEHETWAAVREAAKGNEELAERVDRYLHRPPFELYDLQADPLEKRNLADDPDHADVRRELHERLRAAMAAIRDPFLELH